MNKSLLADLLIGHSAIDSLTGYMDNNLDKSHTNGITAILKQSKITDEKMLFELEDIASTVLGDLEQRSFYLGIDYTLQLLGRPGILEALPECLQPGKAEF